MKSQDKIKFFFCIIGLYDFQKIKIITNDTAIYIEHKTAIFSMENPKSIIKPKVAVAKAVEKNH